MLYLGISTAIVLIMKRKVIKVRKISLKQLGQLEALGFLVIITN